MIRLLATPLKDPSRLPDFVKNCATRGCVLIAVYGPDAGAVHDAIDDHLIWDVETAASRPDHWGDIVTTWHADRDAARELTAMWDGGRHKVEDVTL